MTNSTEHVERFCHYCGSGTSNPLLFIAMSNDRTMGVKVKLDPENIKFEAKMKLKFRPLDKKYIKFGGDYVDIKRVLLAMKILRRRKYLTIGLTTLSNDTTSVVFFLREGDNNVLIAPAVFERGMEESHINIVDIIEPCSDVIMDWLTYATLFKVTP